MKATSVKRAAAPELLLRQRVGALRRVLGGVRHGEPRAIHQARVATRRLREALPLVGAGKPGRRLGQLARRLTQTLGPVRELDVALGMLADFEAESDVPTAALACLRDAIGDERQSLHRAVARQVDEWDLHKLQRKALAALERDGDARPRREQRQEQLAAARRRAGRRAGRLEEAMAAAGGIYLPDRLHDVRIAVKKLRYALEIARQPSTRTDARIQSLKQMQDLLGRMHDLEVLIARTRALQSTSVRDLRLSADLDRLVRRLETECRQLHGQYIARRRTLLDICRRVAAVSEPRQVA